jgi:hypothetical protein
MVESNNNLINFLKLALTTLDSSPTQLPPDNDSGIADSGLRGFYFGPNAPVNNYDATTPKIEIQVANSTPVQSIASAKLASVPDLPASSLVGHVMDSFPHSLTGLTPLVDAGCQVIFTKTLVMAFDANKKAILIGWRETTRPQLWRWPLLPQHPTAPSLAEELRLLAPAAHDSQLDTIDRFCDVINPFHNRPTRLPRHPRSCLRVLVY